MFALHLFWSAGLTVLKDFKGPTFQLIKNIILLSVDASQGELMDF